MREQKFRVWHKENEEYMNGYDVLLKYDGSVISRYTLAVFDTDMPVNVIIEQYTGLKDKNGKEIYEGDVVEQFVCGVKNFKGKKCGRRTVWQVRWNEEECCFELHYLSGSLFGDSMMALGEEYEVIGNIHENFELLGEEEE